MPQAKRIKRKAQPKKRAPSAGWRQLPWGLILVVLACISIIALLIDGSQRGDARFGAGLKQILEQPSPTPKPDPEIAEALENQISDKDFTFYDVLPDIEQIMPDDLPDAAPTRTPDNVDYFLQAASFKAYADAEKLRARLALKGYKSVTQARDVAGKGTYYRVRLGPYSDKRKAKTARNKLQKLGVRPMVYAVNKD